MTDSPHVTNENEHINLLSRLNQIPVTSRIYLITLILVGAWVIEAFDIGIIGTVVVVLQEQWGLTSSQVGLLGISANSGIVIGLIIAGYLADRFGRKRVLVVGVVWFCAFTLLAPIFSNLWWVVAMRFIAGLGEGAVFMLPYLLISEFVNKHRRTTIIGFAGALLISSYVLPSIVGSWSVNQFSPEIAWRVPFIIGGVPILFAIIMAIWVPESPRWLLKQGRVSEVRRFVEKLEDQAGVPHDTQVVDPEVKSSLEAEVEQRRGAFFNRIGTLFKPPFLRRTLSSWLPWTGAVVFFYTMMTYGPTLFAERGLAAGNAILATGVMMVIAGVGTLLQGWLADRYGRKPLLYGYALLGAIGLVVLGYANSAGSIAIAFFLAGFFGLGIHAVTKPYIAEQYPTYLRGTGTGTGEGVGRFFGGVLATFYVPFILSALGVQGVFWFVGIVVVVLMIPMIIWGQETMHMSVEKSGGVVGTGKRAEERKQE